MCIEATNFLARTSGLSANYQTQYTNLICGLVTDGIFAKFDALYIFRTSSSANAVLNLISTSYSITENGSPTFTADQGYTGNGSSMSLDTTINPSSSLPPNYSLNSATFFLWSNTAASDNQSAGGDGGEHTTIYPRQGSVNFLNINETAYDSVASTNGSGLWSVCRTGASTKAGYWNGASILSNSTAAGTLPSSLFFLRSGGFWSGQVSAGGIGAGLTSGENASLYTRLNTFMTNTPIGPGGGLFRQSPLDGLGSGGPFFGNPLSRSILGWRKRKGLWCPDGLFA